MGDIDTYSLVDFMPMEPEVYLRLFVRQNEGMWPLQILTVGLALAVLWFARRGSGRPVGAVLGALSAWVGYSFFLALYAELNWAAEYVGWAFIAHGAALAGYSLTGRFDLPGAEDRHPVDWVGLGVAVFAVVVYPFFIPVFGRSWAAVEVVGAAPDPTAILMLGIVLAGREIRWPLVVVPLLWCLYSGVTSVAMGWTAGLVSPAIAIVVTGLAAWKAVAQTSSDGGR